jgi:hypothetical protein
MTPRERDGAEMIRMVTIGLLSGVVAGTLVGEAEALWVLSSAGSP